MKPTQQQKILAVLQSLQTSDHTILQEYIRRHPTGDGVSALLLVSECNARVSELHSKGYDIETSKEKDRYGFAYRRLKPASVVLSPIAHAAEKCRRFDAGLAAQEAFAYRFARYGANQSDTFSSSEHIRRYESDALRPFQARRALQPRCPPRRTILQCG